MKPQIEKLAKDVGAWFPNGYPSGEGGDEEWLNYVIFKKDQLQKFSQLIIEECLEQVRDEIQYEYDWSLADSVTKRVMEHFGVE